jgi:adenosylcobyric acid synthase
VFPYADDLRVDAEDSLALERTPRSPAPPGASIAIVEFPRLSNGTDFRLLRWADWIAAPRERAYDFVILPGSKDTLSDLAWMRDRSLDEWVRDQYRRGATVIGICGGFQMMGQAIHDPHGLESAHGSATGLGLLPAETVLAVEKTTRLRRAIMENGGSFPAYEIHLGVTTCKQPFPPFARLDDGTSDGVRADRLIGTYLHGALENPQVCAELFGISVESGMGKGAEHAALADWFERYAEEPEAWLG